MKETLPASDHEKRLKEDFVRTYLKVNSVDQIVDLFPGLTFATAHRWLDEYEIVKSVGRNPNKLSSILYFLTDWVLAGAKLPLQKWYRFHTPIKVKESFSMPSMHRVVGAIKERVTNTNGAALVISPEDNPDLVLVGDDITTPSPALGKQYGSLSLPMTYTRRGEHPYLSIKRTLQQEVVSDLVVARNFPEFLIPQIPSSFGSFIISDVLVNAYRLELPYSYIHKLNSPKLKNLRFINASEIKNSQDLDLNIRGGVKEIVISHLKTYNSDLKDLELAALNKIIITQFRS